MWTPPWTLMYHAVLPYDEDPNRVCVSPERFARQMDWLSRRRLVGLSVRELLAQPSARRGHAVGLTFDDGYRGIAEHVLPVLRRHGFTATVFVCSDLLGTHNSWDERPRMALMDADELRELSAAGVEIGSHGRAHRRLPTLDRAELASEIADSRTRLRALLGTEITGFCFPYGEFDADGVAVCRQAGYEYACSAMRRSQPDQGYLIPRAHVGERDGALRLTAKRLLHPLRVALT